MSDISSTSSATNQLTNISQEISTLTNQIRDAQSESSAEKDVYVFEKRTSDIVNDSLQFARDIGVLIKDNSRLNVITNFQKEESADFFKFRITKDGPLTLSTISQLDFQTEDEVAAAEAVEGAEGEEAVEEDKPIFYRIQLLTRNGSLVADNEGDRDDYREAFKALEEGTFEAKKGDYVIKISRANEDPGVEEIQYAVQLTMGDYKNDFDTIDQPYEPGSLPILPELPNATTELLDGLNEGLAFFGNLPPLGQSGTEKLLGAMTDLFI